MTAAWQPSAVLRAGSTAWRCNAQPSAAGGSRGAPTPPPWEEFTVAATAGAGVPSRKVAGNPAAWAGMPHMDFSAI
ncbi:hypothetical protein GCM10009734_59950 [Nonomuraea bangladeshensis]